MTVLPSNEVERTTSAETLDGPGARLRKERESQGLDQVRVAAQLHLSETMIEALEWDDFAALPGAVFTQGYLRNYARLLGVPETEIIAAYQQLCPKDNQECLNAKRPANIKQEVRSSHGLVQLATWLIVIGLIALLFFWWQGRFDWQDALQEEPVLDTEVLDPQLSLDDSLPEMPVAASFAEGDEAPHSSVQAESEPRDGTADQLQRFGDSQTDSLLRPDADLPASEPETEVVAEDVMNLEEAAPPVQEAVMALEPETPPAPPRQLIFEFTGRCWAEVRDATGKAHIIGEKRAGYRRVIESDLGPFKVILGDASVVRLTLDGEPYDLTPHTKGNVARFTLETE